MGSKEFDDVIREFYSTKGSEFCALKIDKSMKFVQNRAGILGLKLVPGLKSQLCSKPRKPYNIKYKIDHNKIINPDSLEACYLLGILWGDGYIARDRSYNKVILRLVAEDFIKIKYIFDYFGLWARNNRKAYENHKEQLGVSTSNKPLFLFLEENDYLIKSIASPTKILSLIPNDLKYMWWRGYSDADGCFTHSSNLRYKNYNLAGRYDADWKSSEEIFQKLNCNYKIILKVTKSKYNNKDHRSSTVNLWSNKSLINWINFIYPNIEYDNFGLERKFDKACNIRNYIINKL
jgi:hypothetical protein